MRLKWDMESQLGLLRVSWGESFRKLSVSSGVLTVCPPGLGFGV